VHEAIHGVRGTRHVPDVFQHAHGGKEDEQDGDEGDHRSHAAQDAIHQQTADPLRRARQGYHQPGRSPGDHLIGQPGLKWGAQAVRQTKDGGQHTGQNDEPPEGVRGDGIQPLRHRHLAGTWSAKRCLGHLPDPGVATACYSENRVLMLPKDRPHRVPALWRQGVPHHADHLAVALEEFQGHPVHWVRLRHVVGDPLLDAAQHLLMVRAYLRPIGLLGLVREGYFDSRIEQFVHSAGMRRDHRDDGNTDLPAEQVGPHLDALLLGDVDHVQADHQWGRESQQLSDQIEVALQ